MEAQVSSIQALQKKIEESLDFEKSDEQKGSPD
jgi:hypothetical protein